MSNDNTILIAALAVGAVLVMNKAKAAGGLMPAGVGSARPPTVNVQNELWTGLLGGAWKAISGATRSDGGPAFLMKNFLGQTVTSDGKPVGQELSHMFPATYGELLPVDVSLGGDDYASDLFDYNY